MNQDTKNLIEDLFPPGFGDLSLMNKEIISIYGSLKSIFPAIFVNAANGKRIFNFCGWRPQNCIAGAKNSPHKQGLALDLHMPTKAQNEHLYDYMLKVGYSTHGFTRMEDRKVTIDQSKGGGWVHVDIVPLTDVQKGRTAQIINGIYVFMP